LCILAAHTSHSMRARPNNYSIARAGAAPHDTRAHEITATCTSRCARPRDPDMFLRILSSDCAITVQHASAGPSASAATAPPRTGQSRARACLSPSMHSLALSTHARCVTSTLAMTPRLSAQSSTVMPMFLAVPITVFMADWILFVLRSGSLIFAISSTCAMVTEPALT